MTRGRHHTHAYHVPELGRKVKRPKVGYETEEAARAGLEEWKLAPTFRHDDSELVVYQCQYCRQWHIGHYSKRQAYIAETTAQGKLYNKRVHLYWLLRKYAERLAVSTGRTTNSER